MVGSFDEDAVGEGRAGADEGNQVGCVHGAPAVLGGLDELVGHRYSGGAGAGSFRHALAQPDGGEGRLDRIGRAQVDPVLGGKVVEGQQDIAVLCEAFNSLRILRPEGL